MNTSKNFIILILLFNLFGCKSENEPLDLVVDSNQMTVYSAKVRQNELKTDGAGIYEYWVTDKSQFGWRFETNQKFNVGDVLVISKKN